MGERTIKERVKQLLYPDHNYMVRAEIGGKDRWLWIDPCNGESLTDDERMEILHKLVGKPYIPPSVIIETSGLPESKRAELVESAKKLTPEQIENMRRSRKPK